MYKVKVIGQNCMAVINGRTKRLEVGEVIDTVNPNAFGAKGELVHELKLEVATPEPRKSDEWTDKYEDNLRDFIYEQTGKRAGGRASISTLEKQAKKLGWEA